MRGLLAVLVGFLIGGFVNMGVIMVGPELIPLPPEIDPTDPESLKAHADLLESKHFITPWVAHAMGTLVGALVGLFIAKVNRAQKAFIIGVLFLIGGITAAAMIPAPMWFVAADLLLAYIPMAWLATKILGREDRA
ncbi:MAG: hypothetical protein ACYS26_02475 [Planctomycetota bacterium]|jgi:hypothetical protein